MWPSSIATAPVEAREPETGGRNGRAAAIYRCVFDAIVDHRLPPGAKLIEEQLGDLFNASRTLVRSALQALAHDHIVTIERHRGAFVAAPSVADAQDIFFSRRLVESAIALEAADRIGAAEIAALRALLTHERDALDRGDRRAAIRLSGEFHMTIARVTGEGALTRFLASLISRSSLVIALYGRGQASACGHDEHMALADALEAGDGARASALMALHLDHIVADLALAPRDEAQLDVVEILREQLARP